MTFSFALLLAAVAVATGFALAATQARINTASGSDHHVHAFLIRAIRANGYRLFTRIPRLLNPTYCAALPLYLHWIFAHFGERVMVRAERLLNPAVNAAVIALTAVIAAGVAAQIGAGPWFLAAAAGALAVTPQFYHALSARNFGLSARGIGLFLLAAAIALGQAVETETTGVAGWAGLIVASYLVIAFSTFAAQALTILGLLALILFGHWTLIAGEVAGIALFLALHPRYGSSYIYRTLRFIHGYATELAPVYVLARRFSIWRDLVWDIWRKIAADPVQGFRYAYENSALIVIGLNPLLTITIVAWAVGSGSRYGALGYVTDIALCGALAALLTSFRATRFLGEPERYAEAVAPFAAIAGVAALAATGSAWLIAALIGIALAVDLAQIQASRMLRRHLSQTPLDVTGLEAVIKPGSGEPRCAGNNDQIIKMLLSNDWQFVYCMAIEGRHCGLPISQVFSTFPFVRRDALQQIVRSMQIDMCVLDRTLYDTLFDDDDGPASKILYESPRLRVLRLDWSQQ